MSKQHQSSSSSRPYSGLFQIPIFPPLPAGFSFDAPAPVIVPPGSDPGTLNFNLDDGNVLDTPSLMDSDPCVVAWRGSDTKRVDLTADEHAGVSLSVPATMVNTVNDVTCNSDKAIEIHMEGNMHLKNTQNLTVNRESEEKNSDLENVTRIVSPLIEQETPFFAANGAIDEDLEKKKQDLLQKEDADKSLFVGEYPESLFVCDIPEPGREYTKIATVEVDESLFKNLTSVQTSKSDTQNKSIKVSVNQSNWCDICKVSCNGDKSFDSHIAGKQHQKNLKISAKTPTQPQTTFTTSMDTTPITKSMEESKSVNGNSKTIWCEVCKVSCSTNLYDKHVSGKKHIKKLQKLEIVPNVTSTVVDSVAAPLAEKLKLIRGEVVDPNEGNSASCELCGIYCSTRDLLHEHISGKKHQKNLKKSETLCVRSPAPVVKTLLLPDLMNEEGGIVALEGIKRKADGSLSSEEDADTKRQKMDEEEACAVLVTCRVCNVSFDSLMAFRTHLSRH